VIIGSIIGLTIHPHLPERLKNITFQAIGIFTLFWGFTMALTTKKILLTIFAFVSGSIIGELLYFEFHLNDAVEHLKRKLKIGNPCLTEGIVTAFLIFCMGSMTILGSIEEGLGQPPSLYLAKSILDGFAAVALTAALGIGVMFSALPLFIYQAGLTIFARLLSSFLLEAVTNELSLSVV